MSILERIGKMDRRWWYLVLAIIMAFPMIRPIGLPISVQDWTVQFYKALQQLKEGDTVLFSTSYISTAAADIDPGARAAMRVLMQEGVKVVFVSFAQQGDTYAEAICKDTEASGGKYGEDFVNLGFVAGGESGLAGFARNVSGLLTKDYRGNTVSSLPIMKGLNAVPDFRATILATSGAPIEVAVWTRQITEPYKVPALMVYPGTGGTSVSPYLQSGQVLGLLAGMPCAAQLEKISGMPGPALAGMDAQSMGHFFFLVIVIIGNLASWMEKRAKRGSRPEEVASNEH